jgi:hypothetical protein
MTARPGKKDGNVTPISYILEDDDTKASIKVGLYLSTKVEGHISAGSRIEQKDVVRVTNEEKHIAQIPKNDKIERRSIDLSLNQPVATEGREQALRTALKYAQSRGLPDGWTCVYGVSSISLM